MKTFSHVLIEAQLAGETAVNDFLKTHREPNYCGYAYLYTTKPKPRTRTGKRIEDQRIRPSGFAAQSQSLDLREMWCNAARKVFEANGIEVFEKSWVD